MKTPRLKAKNVLKSLLLAIPLLLFYQNCGEVKLVGGESIRVLTCEEIGNCESPVVPTPDTPIQNPDPGPVSDPAPVVIPQANIPGWTGTTPSRPSCSYDVQLPPATTVEPSLPMSCLQIPGYNQGGVILNDGDSNTSDLLTRDMTWSHIQQGEPRCAGGSEEPTTYNRFRANTARFYSIRIKPEIGEAGSITFAPYNPETNNAIGIVSISECPGDFGQIHDVELMLQLRLDEYAGVAPPANALNTVRRLYHHSLDLAQHNQKYVFSSNIRKPNWKATERCIAPAMVTSGGHSMYYNTGSFSSVFQYAQGCRLEANKTYYINFAFRSIYDNSQYLQPNVETQITGGIMRSCFSSDGNIRTCSPTP